MISSVTSAKKIKIPHHIAEQILTVGFEYKNHRGGIGGVIDTYARYFEEFKFISTYPTHPNKWTLLFYFFRQYFYMLLMLLTDKKIKIVHIHGAAKGSFYRKYIIFLTAKYLFKLQVIYHSHGSEFKLFYTSSSSIIKAMIHHYMENVDTIICLSKQWEIFFRENFNVKKLIILGNVVERPKPFTRKNIHEPQPIRLLFLGLIGDRKGIFDLLQAIEKNKEKLKGRLQLVIGGNGNTARLLKFIELHQLQELVQYAGWISGDQKRHWLRNSDVYVLPSYNEGLPLSILEAMSYNMPILSTPVGGTSEIVCEGINGFLVKPGDQDALIDRLFRFINHPELVTTMGIESGTIVQQYFPESVFPKLLTIYEYLLNKDTH